MSKKRLAAIAVVFFMLIFVLTGCGTNKSDEESGRSKVDYNINMQEAKAIRDKIEVTIKSNKIVNKVAPPVQSGYYTYYEAGSGKKYVDVVADIKNLTSEAIKIGEVCKVKLYIDDKEYDTSYMCEEKDGERINGYATYVTIDPLTTKTFHFATKVDEELVSNETTARLVFLVDEKAYSYAINIVKDDSENSQKPATINLNYKGKEIFKDQLVKVDEICEFTIKGVDFKSKVLPKNPTGYYHYVEAANGKVYVDAQVEVKNLKNSAVKQDTMLGKATLVYKGSYEYDCSKAVEKNNGEDMNTYTSLYDIEPLTTMDYHVLAEIPEEVKESTDPIYLRLTINGEDYYINIR